MDPRDPDIMQLYDGLTPPRNPRPWKELDALRALQLQAHQEWHAGTTLAGKTVTATRVTWTKLIDDLDALVANRVPRDVWHADAYSATRRASKMDGAQLARRSAQRYLRRWLGAAHAVERAVLWEKARLAKRQAEELAAQGRREGAPAPRQRGRKTRSPRPRLGRKEKGLAPGEGWRMSESPPPPAAHFARVVVGE